MPSPLERYLDTQSQRFFSLEGPKDDIIAGVQTIISALSPENQKKIKDNIDDIGAAILRERAKEKINTGINFFGEHSALLYIGLGFLLFKIFQK
ncbi:MAG: hypothetical protein ACREYE_12920 [Gammaproteobacteria bacterium]